MPNPSAETDKQLLAQARTGDARAFRMLVERYEGKVAATVVGMLGPGPEADDVGQETFIRFYRSIDKFRGDAALGTYLTRIAINQSLKALQRRKTWRQRFLRSDDVDTPLPDPAVEGDRDLESQERKVLVQAALQRLKPEQRAVVVLRMMEGYSTNETADLLGIRPGTVMSRLSRALARLQTILGPTLALSDDTP